MAAPAGAAIPGIDIYMGAAREGGVFISGNTVMSMIREIKHSQPVCEACGQPVLVHSELPPLTPTQQTIFDIVRKRPGVSAEQLRGLVWQHDPSGGPECRNTIFVHLGGLNARLRSIGITVRSEGGSYRIRSVTP
jgi:hypothetical protein